MFKIISLLHFEYIVIYYFNNRHKYIKDKSCG